MFHIVTGGSGSGKSAYAEELICQGHVRQKVAGSQPAGKLIYIATMVPRGEETRLKIKRHRDMRDDKGFVTIECSTNLCQLTERGGSLYHDLEHLNEEEKPSVLLECMSNLVANELYETKEGESFAVKGIMAGVEGLVRACQNLVIVTNEVCIEVPGNCREMDKYKRILSEINQALCDRADTVTEVIYGIPNCVKGKGEKIRRTHLAKQGLEEYTKGNENNYGDGKEVARMKMVLGGAHQGKRRYAEALYGSLEWVDGSTCSFEELYKCEGIFHFEEYIRRLMQENRCLEGLEGSVAERNKGLVIVTNEIGCGLVPVNSFEREYREQAGRICTRLAALCERVDKVVCGLGTKLKEKKWEQMEVEQVLPADIEAKSFEIITRELGDIVLESSTAPIVKRCIHTSADFSYAQNLVFSPKVVEKALQALREGANIVTDTQMVKAGINKKKLEKYGGSVVCFMSDEDVAQAAKDKGTTRAVASMEKAAALEGNLIFAIGNAPTALIKLHELIQAGKLKPKLVIAVPVGFVNVVPSKELILALKETPHIVAEGRKGGSNIAACICNALLYMLDKETE